MYLILTDAQALIDDVDLGDTDIMGPPNPTKKKAFSKSAIAIEIERERLLFERHRMNMNLKSNIWNWR